MKTVDAEKNLERCEGCGDICETCIHIGEVMDSIMAINYVNEIAAYEDALEKDIERLIA